MTFFRDLFKHIRYILYFNTTEFSQQSSFEFVNIIFSRN